MRRAPLAAVLCALAAKAFGEEPGASEREHVPPDPPQTRVHEMPYHEMADMMGMDDRKRFAKVMIDRLEWHDADTSTYEWEAAAWYGGDFHKLWLETEGENADGDTHDARVEVLWDRIATAWWSTRLGVRQDFGEDEQTWLAFGVAGLAPGFIELAAMAYLGDEGRAALRLSADYDLLLTQRLILQPEAEVNLYSGESDLEVGLRLRYEIRREIAPYLGVSWSKRDDESGETAFVAGLRLWF
ncbi:MAG TPA: copper resistance protein B [Steroidobacteraceae bacterium]|nr:copper resistance protein B [Steroidobacteraceae bacterium]